MKIISKYKDYYDFIAGIYGIDSAIIYDRHFQKVSEKSTEKVVIWEKASIENTVAERYFATWLFAICGKFYFIAKCDNQFYFGGEGWELLPNIIQLPTSYSCRKSDYSLGSGWHLKETDLNDKYGCPILLLKTPFMPKFKNPKLADYGFAKFIDAKDMFAIISTWLVKEDIVIDNRTDIEKLQNAGFDKITSFRKV